MNNGCTLLHDAFVYNKVKVLSLEGMREASQLL